MSLCAPCHSQKLEEKPLTDIANAFKAPWIGWQELCIAGLPLRPEESEAILSKLSHQSVAQTSAAAILEKNGKIDGFEFKWKSKPSTKLPKTFVEGYNASQTIIDRENFRDFVIMK